MRWFRWDAETWNTWQDRFWDWCFFEDSGKGCKDEEYDEASPLWPLGVGGAKRNPGIPQEFLLSSFGWRCKSFLGATTHATTAAATNGPEAWWLASRWRRSDSNFGTPSDAMTQFRKCYFGKETLQTIVDYFEHVSQTNTVNSLSLPMWPGAPKKPCSMLHSKWKTWADSWKPHSAKNRGGSAVERSRVPRYQTCDTVGPNNPAPVAGSSGRWSSRHADGIDGIFSFW